ncbi:T9SS type A sorting domain-containing protein [Calditrichota bacterium GD2]
MEKYIENGFTYSWRVYAYDNFGFKVRCEQDFWTFTFDTVKTAINDNQNNIPNNFVLSQNYPNPFNPTTTIKYGIPRSVHVTIEIYNLLGQRVDVLINQKKNAGYYQLQWDGSHLASGIYFYRMSAGEYVEMKKLLLLK